MQPIVAAPPLRADAIIILSVNGIERHMQRWFLSGREIQLHRVVSHVDIGVTHAFPRLEPA